MKNHITINKNNPTVTLCAVFGAIVLSLVFFMVFSLVTVKTVKAEHGGVKVCSGDSLERQACERSNEIIERFCHSGDLLASLLCEQGDMAHAERDHLDTVATQCQDQESGSDARGYCSAVLFYNYSLGGATYPDGAVVGADGTVHRSGNVGDGETSLQADCVANTLTPANCGIIGYIRLITDALTVLVGIVVVMMLVVGGIQYSSAGSNPQAVAAAKKRISQALFALVIYIFLWAFLQWLVPGGVA